MLEHKPKQRRRPRRVGSKPLAFCGLAWLALLAGCAHEQVIVRSECPEPNPVEAQDLSDWLLEEPERPAQVWAARVVGHLYPEDLATERGETPEERSWGGWLISPFWGLDDGSDPD